jgi:hypothetical protein
MLFRLVARPVWYTCDSIATVGEILSQIVEWFIKYVGSE